MPLDAVLTSPALPGSPLHRRRAYAPPDPVGWHGFRPPAAAPDRRTIWTGHPPPSRQVRDQVRGPFGFTWGVATPIGARPRRLRPSRRAPQAVSDPAEAAFHVRSGLYDAERRALADAKTDRVGRAALLLAVLHELSGELPPGAILADILSNVVVTSLAQVGAAFATLRRTGVIHLWTAEMPKGRPMQRAVRIVSTGRVLRSAGAPAEVFA